MNTSKALPYVLLIIATIIWGSNFALVRAIASEVPPLTLAYLQWVVAVVIFLPFVWKEMAANRQILTDSWKSLLLMGITGVAAFTALIYLGLPPYTVWIVGPDFISHFHPVFTINESIVNTITPLIIIVLSYFFLKEQITCNQLLGLILSISGVFLVLHHHTWGELSFNIYDLIVFVTAILWGVYSIIVKYNSGRIPLCSSLAISMVIGMFILLPFSLWEIFIDGQMLFLSISSIASIAYLGIFASIVAFLSWNKAVSLIGPGKAAIFLSLVPIFTIISSNQLIFAYIFPVFSIVAIIIVAIVAYVSIFAYIFTFFSWNKVVSLTGILLSLVLFFTIIFGGILPWYQIAGIILVVTGIYLFTRVPIASSPSDL